MGFPPHLPCHSPGLHPSELRPRLHSSQRGGVRGLRRSSHCPYPDGKGFQVYFPPRTEQGHTLAAETVATDFQIIYFQGVNQQRDAKGHIGEDLGFIYIEQALLFMVSLMNSLCLTGILSLHAGVSHKSPADTPGCRP